MYYLHDSNSSRYHSYLPCREIGGLLSSAKHTDSEWSFIDPAYETLHQSSSLPDQLNSLSSTGNNSYPSNPNYSSSIPGTVNSNVAANVP